jgi:hypothetical protein
MCDHPKDTDLASTLRGPTDRTFPQGGPDNERMDKGKTWQLLLLGSE